MKKIKILFLIPSLRGEGAERIVLNLARHLSIRKASLGLVVMKKKGEYQNLVSEDIDFLFG